jgi:phosphoribosylformimino-5-aminoimidazole carboxamide ribotide isomerase
VIIPSIDLMNGNAVQLVGGREKKLDAGDPRPLIETFRLSGEVAIVDLDAALSQGNNDETILDLIRMADCRVGGGIRDVATAIKWLDAGATKLVLGTAATPEVLSQLPPERVVAALDAENDEVVVEGWRKKTGATVLDRMKALKGLAGGFLVTFVEREGRMGGTNMDQVEKLVAAAYPARVTIAGGITTAEEIAALDKLGADAQVGMAIYSGALDFGDCIAAPLVSDRADGLWPTIVADESGKALGLVYSSLESLREAVKLKRGVYQSRSRGLWVKGLTSGATQELLRIDLDCDRDALQFIVRQSGSGFCHLNTQSCFGDDSGLTQLERTLSNRVKNAPPGSYTARLLSDEWLLKEKLIEEAGELAAAKTREDVADEAADLIYFAMVAMARGNVTLADLEATLDRRALKVTRRPGNAKTVREEGE